VSTATLPKGWSLVEDAPGLPKGWTLAEPESKPLTASRVAELAGDVAAEAGGATAGQMLGVAGGPFAPITVPLSGFIGGGIGNAIAQGRRMARGEQEEGFRYGELLGAAGISAIPGGQVAKGATVLGRIARSATVMGGAGAAGNVVQQVIDRPEGQAFDGAQVATAGALGAAGGTLVQGGIEGFKGLAGLFRRTPPAAFEAATAEEVIAGIAKAEGLAPSEVERRIARARNVTPQPPAPELPLGARVGQLDGPPGQLALPEGWSLAPVPAAQADLDAALARQARPSARPVVDEIPSAPAQVAPPEPLPAPVDNAPVVAPPARLPEPAPLAAPAQTSGVNQAPTYGDTITKPGFGGAAGVAPAAPTSKPAITLPDAATAQTWASRNADRFKSVAIRENPAGGFDVFTEAKGSKFAFGARPDGGTDIIDIIQSLGGVPPPPKGATGGEWDGFGEVFAGPAKILINAKKRGLGLDQFLGNLADTKAAHLAGNPDGFKQAVSDALAERARLKIANTLEANTAKFQTAILTGKGRGGKEPPAGKTDFSDNLNPGDEFGVKGTSVTVTGVDLEGNVTLQDGPRFQTQIIPPGVEIHPDARSMKKVPREQPKANAAPQSTDPFGDNFVPEPDVPAAVESPADAKYRLQGEKMDGALKQQRANADAAEAAKPPELQDPDFWVSEEVRRIALERGLSIEESRQMHRTSARAMMLRMIKRQVDLGAPIHVNAVGEQGTHLGYLKKTPNGYVRDGDYYVKEPATPEAAYDASLQQFREASRKFTEIQKQYRAKIIGDTEFLAGRKAFDAAMERSDAAEKALLAAKNTPGTQADLVAGIERQATALEPWQMNPFEYSDSVKNPLPAEFGALDAIAKIANRSSYNPDALTLAAIKILKDNEFVTGQKHFKLTEKGRNHLTDLRQIERANSLASGAAYDNHLELVQQALNSGKPVPTEVLNHYGELLVKPPAKPVPPPAENWFGHGMEISTRKQADDLAEKFAKEQKGRDFKVGPHPAGRGTFQVFSKASQRGAIDPAVMRAVGFAAARGVAGAAVGTLLADTPEERAGYALAGGLLGVSASPALAKMLGRATFSTTSVGRRAFPEATIPFDLREQLILKPGAVAATGHRGNNAQRALEVALRKEADPSAAAHEVWEFLTAKSAGVRPSLAATATEARTALDELSDKLILSGLATGTLADTINANKGSYLRRAFRIFQSPGWRPEQKVIDDWQAAYLAANPTKTAQDAQDLALELLDRRNAEEFVMTGSLLRQNRDSFKPRKNLDAPTLALLGEITEPVELLGQTVPRMARLVETHETQKNLARIGQQMGHFSPRSDPSRGHIVQLAKSGDYPAVGPLAGLWTTPELREALEAATAGQSEQSLVWRTLAGATTLAKFSKTVLNPESWVPNGIGAVVDGLKNGNVRIMANGPAWKDAVLVGLEELGTGSNPQTPAGRATTAAIYAKMQRLGLAGQGSSADFQRGLEMAWGETTQRGAKRTMLTLGRSYASSENVMRYMWFQAEKAAYGKAFPRMAEAELEAYAARVVRSTTTNYAMIPETLRKASTAGVLGTFVNFPYEQFRHAFNIARIAKDDMAKGAATNNPALVAVGARRLAAFLAAAAGTGAVAAYSMRKEGITPEQDAALRRRFAPWDRNQSLIYHARDGDNIAYMNQSYVNPQAVLLAGGSAAARGESLEQAATNFLKAGQETFGGGSVLLNPGLETLLNRTERGRQISSPEDSAAKQANDRISYLADRAYSPGFLNSLSRIAKGYKGETGPDGQVYTLGDAMQRLVGRRINRVNLPYRFEREAFDMSRRLAEVHSSYAGVRRREETNAPEKVDQAYQIGEQRRQVVFKDLTQYIADARVLGYDEDKTVAWMRKGGVPAEIALGALEGRYTPGERLHAKTGQELLAEIRAKPAAEQLSAFVAEVTKNPAFISTVKGAMLDQARGVTQRDKLVAALDPEKRAAYFEQRMSQQTETQRLEYLHELGRKHLLTPEVVRQMVKPK